MLSVVIGFCLSFVPIYLLILAPQIYKQAYWHGRHDTRAEAARRGFGMWTFDENEVDFVWAREIRRDPWIRL